MLSKILPKFRAVAPRWTSNIAIQHQPKNYNSSFKDEMVRAFGSIDPDSIEGKVLEIQNEVIFFGNPKSKPLGYKTIVKTADDKDALVLSLNQEISGALVLGDSLPQTGQSMNFSNLPSVGVNTVLDYSNFGRIVNYRGDVIQGEARTADGPKVPIYNRFKKLGFNKKVENQLFTGNISIDFTQPLARGNFICFQGESNTGKTSLAAQTSYIFLKNEMFERGPKPRKVIYVSVNINNANSFFKSVSDYGIQDEVVVFSAKFKSLSEKYFAPFAALAYANSLKAHGNDVLLIFDDIVEHYTKELLIFNTVNQPFGNLNILQEMYVSTGISKEGSITSILVYDENQSTNEYRKYVDKYYVQLESIADSRIEFNLIDPLYKNAMPKLDLKVNKNLFQWQPHMIRALTKRLSDLLERLKEEKESIYLKKELKIQVDPWDCYLFLDSTYFMRLLISARKMSVAEEITIVGVVLRAVEEDTISYFKDDPNVFMNELFEFIKNIEDFEKTDLVSYITRLAKRDLDQAEVTEQVIQSINRIYELFFIHCKMQNKIHQFKKDYFN